MQNHYKERSRKAPLPTCARLLITCVLLGISTRGAAAQRSTEVGVGGGLSFLTSGDVFARHAEAFVERPLRWKRVSAQARFTYVWASQEDTLTLLRGRAYDRKRYHVGVGLKARVVSFHTAEIGISGGFNVRHRDDLRPAGVFYPAYFESGRKAGRDFAAEIEAACRTISDCTSRRIEYAGGPYGTPGTHLILTRHFGGVQFGYYVEPEVSARIGSFRFSALVGGRYHFVKSQDAAGNRFDALDWHTGFRVAKRL